MNTSIYKIYQGEDFDIFLNGKNSNNESVDISDIDISIGFINTALNKIEISSQNNELEITRPSKNSIKIAVSNAITKILPCGDYVISFVLTKNNKRVIEEIYLLKVLNSLIGRQ